MIKIELTDEFLEWLAEQLQSNVEKARDFASEFISMLNTLGILNVVQQLRPITRDEWDKYRWIEITTLGDECPIFIRGVECVEPPDDDFVYIERTGLRDSKQRWQRAMTVEGS